MKVLEVAELGGRPKLFVVTALSATALLILYGLFKLDLSFERRWFELRRQMLDLKKEVRDTQDLVTGVKTGDDLGKTNLPDEDKPA